MKKILITGATGFIGSHLTELCVKKGYDVVAFDRYNTTYNLGHLENSEFKKDINFIFGDIRDYDTVFKISKKCNAIFHLAALVGIPYSYFSPLAYLKVNLEGTYNILEAAKNLNTEQVLITSTSETYGSAESVPINEKHRLNAQSPYSASKISADQLALSYWNSFNLPVKIVRPFNVYGPRQSTRAVIPSIIIQALNLKKQIKLGNIMPTRDLTYVTDTCKAYFEIMKTKSFFGRAINVGSNNEYQIKSIAKKIIQKIDPEAQIYLEKKRKRPNTSEVDRLVCDNRLILKNTKWKPKINFSEGLDLTIEWFKENKEKFYNNIYHI